MHSLDVEVLAPKKMAAHVPRHFGLLLIFAYDKKSMYVPDNTDKGGVERWLLPFVGVYK